MPDLFTDEYEKAKERWEKSRDAYDEAIRLYDAIYALLQRQFVNLEDAHKEFHAQQTKVIKSGKNLRSVNLKVVKKGE
jgi:hypothetical protein